MKISNGFVSMRNDRFCGCCCLNYHHAAIAVVVVDVVVVVGVTALVLVRSFVEEVSEGNRTPLGPEGVHRRISEDSWCRQSSYTAYQHSLKQNLTAQHSANERSFTGVLLMIMLVGRTYNTYLYQRWNATLTRYSSVSLYVCIRVSVRAIDVPWYPTYAL